MDRRARRLRVHRLLRRACARAGFSRGSRSRPTTTGAIQGFVAAGVGVVADRRARAHHHPRRHRRPLARARDAGAPASTPRRSPAATARRPRRDARDPPGRRRQLPAAATRARARRVSRAASRLAGLGTTIFTRDVGARGAHRRDQPRPGLPRRGRPARGARRRRRRAARGHNQYAPLPGVPALRDAIAAHQRARATGSSTRTSWSRSAPPRRSPRRCSGCASPGDEVVALEPVLRLLPRGRRVRRRDGCSAVTLRPPDFALRPRRAGGAAITPRTRVLLLNTPHNPSGRVLDRAELEAIAARLRRARPASRSPTRSTSTSSSTASTSRWRRCRGWPSAR